MYLPRHFEHGEGADLRRLIAAYPLATLVHQTESGADANHIPMRWREDDERSLLVGHVARGNRLWREADGQQVLAIFHGPQAYVSPQWYPSKRVDGRAVPTWNYAVVHVRGRLRAIEDADWLYAFLDELSAAHETFQPRPWRINEAPADYLQKQLRAIVGIELTVEQIVGKYKLHQNHPDANWQGVVDGLGGRDQGDQAVAELMQQTANRDRSDQQ